MAQTIKLKRSGTQNAVPTTSQLALGEVAINTYDGKMYIKKNDGSDSIVEIGGDATSSSGLDFTGNLNLADDVRIVIGDGNDLQIWHDGSNSYIVENGTGDLFLGATNLRLTNGNASSTYLQGIDGGAVDIRHNNSVKLATTSTGVTVTGTLVADGLDLGDNNVLNVGTIAVDKVKGDADDNTNITFAGNDVTAFYQGGAEKIRIDADGRLLVNTTSSVDNFAKIQVVGDSSSLARITLKDVDGTNQYTYFEQSGGGTRINTQNGTSNGFFTIGGWNGTASVDLLRVTGDGRVGIGTNAPAKELHIASSGPDILLQDTDGTNQTSEITSSGGNLFLGSRNDTANGLIVFRGLGGGVGDEYARFNSNGKLGIGITSPEHPLHVSFSGDDGAQIKSTDNHASLYINAGSGYGSYIRFEENNAQNYWINADTNGRLLFRPGGGSSNWITFDSSGRVGIGTTAPSEKLEVTGTIKQAGTYNLTLSDGANITGSNHVYIKANSSYVRIDAPNNSVYYNAGTDHIFRGGDSTEYMRIDTNGTNAGNVGIGTASPGRKLTVQGASGDNLPLRIIGGSGTSHGSMEFQDPNTTADYKVAIGSKGDAFYVQAGGSERVRIHSSGQLGIGVTNFTNALRGNGKQLIIGSCFVATGAALVVDDFARFGGGLYIHEDAGTNNANVTSLDNNGDRLVITGKAGTTNNALDAPDGFYVGGTQFITSSRQITNVTSITATGAISTTGTASFGAINVGSSTSGNVFFKRPNANYIFADQSGGYLVFGTNGRSTSIANSNFYLATNQDVNFQGSISVASNATISGETKTDSLLVENPSTIGHTAIGSISNDDGSGYIRSSIVMTRDEDQITYNGSTDTWTHAGGSQTDWSMITHSANAGFQVYSGAAVSSSTNYTHSQFNDAYRHFQITAAGKALFYGNVQLDGTLQGPATFTIDPSTHGDDTGTVVIAGNLQVDGTTTTINSTTLTVDDKNITLASGSTNAAAANGAGLTVDCGSDTDATLTYLSSGDKWQFNKELVVQEGSSAVAFNEYSNGATIWLDGSDGDFTGGDYFNISAYGTTDLAFGYGAATKITMKNDGKLGIGTTTPNNKLTVTGAGDGINLTGSGAYLRWNSGDMMIKNEGSYKMGFYTYNATDVALNQRMVIDTNGNVGIGTNNPVYTLVVSEDGNDNIEIGAGIIQRYNRSSSAYQAMNYYAYSHNFYTTGGGHQSLFIKNDGNVGIGTSTPYSGTNVKSLTVNATSYPALALQIGGNNAGLLMSNSSGTDLYALGNKRLQFKTNDTTRIKIAGTGEVTFNEEYTFPTSDGSGNQVLQTDGSGNVSWASIAGVGTATTISDADGDTKIQTEEGADDDTIRFDTAGTQRMVIDSTGNVGINSASPAKTLVVGGTFQATGEAFFSHFDNITSSSRMRDDLRLNFGTARTFAITGNSTNMHMKNGTSDVITLDTASNVGIGTSSPATRLHVSGAYGTPQMRIGYDGTAGNGIFFHAQGGSTHINWLVGQQRSLQGFEITPSTAVGGTTFSTPAFVINTGGNVGIGTTSPETDLNLRDRFYSPNETTGRILNWYASTGGTELNNTNHGFVFCDEDTTTTQPGRVGLALANNTTTNNVWSPAITFGGLSTSGNYQSAGAGIAAKLPSAADTNFRSGELHFFVSGTANADRGLVSKMVINSVGNVGIGTTSPSRKFEIHENTTNLTIGEKSGYSPGTYGPVFETNADALVLPQYAYLKGSQAYIRNESNLMRIHGDSGIKFSYYNGSTTTEGMRLDNSGRFGIGTTSPAKALHVAGDVQIGESSGGEKLFFRGGSTKYNFMVGKQINVDNGFEITPSTAVDGMTFSTPAVVVKQDGNVGIGTTSPSQALHVAGKIYTSGVGGSGYFEGHRIIFEGTSSYANIGSNAYQISNVTNDGLVFGRSSSPLMTLDTSGRLGIGTTSPLATLDVRGDIELNSSYPVIRFKDSDSENDFSIIGGSGLFRIYDEDAATARLAIKSDGNVGIGTTSPSAKLQVEELGIDTTTTTTSATTQVAIDTMAAATFRSAEFTIQVTNTTDSTYHLTKVLLIHDGTTPGITEYGTVFTGSAAEATFNADISSGNVRLLATPASTDSMTFKVVRHCITV